MIRKTTLATLLVGAALVNCVFAHDLHEAERPDHAPHYDYSIKPPLILISPDSEDLLSNAFFLLTPFDSLLVIPVRPSDPELDMQNQVALAIAEIFRPFAPSVRVRWDDKYFYVESNGFPNHRMMVGITAWQQQVPIPQRYVGDNAWRFPLVPSVASNPLSANDHFFRGAIAIAANGVPIFNPIKNDGRTDTFLAGELDEYGGHAGRADDYHYHIAPLHLQSIVGAGKAIAYALDGYPIYGLTEPDGSKPEKLDSFNGHSDAKGYHYHSTKSYPYINGGFHGQVTDRDGQVDPQPRADGVRPATEPLRGAKIIEYTINPDKSITLTYTLSGEKRKVIYTVLSDGSYRFEFVDGKSGSTVETYSGDNRRGGGGERPQRKDGDRGNDQRRDERGGGEKRVPWIIQHASEMDADKDGSLTRSELDSEVTKAFGLYDKNRDGGIDTDELAAGNVRSALGGFVRQHSAEIDSNNDRLITKTELSATVLRMFERADQNRDGKLGPEETKDATPLDRPQRRDQ